MFYLKLGQLNRLTADDGKAVLTGSAAKIIACPEHLTDCLFIRERQKEIDTNSLS